MWLRMSTAASRLITPTPQALRYIFYSLASDRVQGLIAPLAPQGMQPNHINLQFLHSLHLAGGEEHFKRQYAVKEHVGALWAAEKHTSASNTMKRPPCSCSSSWMLFRTVLAAGVPTTNAWPTFGRAASAGSHVSLTACRLSLYIGFELAAVCTALAS